MENRGHVNRTHGKYVTWGKQGTRIAEWEIWNSRHGEYDEQGTVSHYEAELHPTR